MVSAFNSKRNGYDLHEFFADEFACALLMPVEDILACRKQGLTIAELATRYEVPRNDVIAWLQRLASHPPE